MSNEILKGISLLINGADKIAKNNLAKEKLHYRQEGSPENDEIINAYENIIESQINFMPELNRLSKISIVLNGVERMINFNLIKTPHLLVAGNSGSGKTFFLKNNIIKVLLKNYTKKQVTPYVIDLKVVDYMSFKSEILVIDTLTTAIVFLTKMAEEMERRYAYMRDKKKLKLNVFPYLVIVIDELSELLSNPIARDLLLNLLQKGRASRIIMVCATQRPSAKLIGGDIKANLPSQIAFKVSNKQESRMVIGVNGAEKIRGVGKAMYNINGS